MMEVDLGNEGVATEGGDHAKDVVERGVKTKLVAGDTYLTLRPIGEDKSRIRRHASGFFGMQPSGDEIKCMKGGSRNGPAVWLR